MARVRARACILAGAAATLIAAVALGATEPRPTHAVDRPVPTTGSSQALTNEGHPDPTTPPTPAPTPMPSDHVDAMPSDHGHGGHDAGPASAAPSRDPHGHGDPAATPAGSPMPHGTTSPEPSHGDHGPTDDHGTVDDDPGEQPREAVIGGFFALNGLVLAAAAFTRRRDRARAAARTTSISRKDASR